MNKSVLGILGIVTLGLASASAFAASNGPRIAVGGIAGITGARTDSGSIQNTGITTDRKIGWGGGLLVEAPLTDDLGIEIGGLYLNRKFEVGGNNLNFTRSVPTIFVPLEARFWLGNIFSVAGGGFYSLRIGDENNSINSGNSTLVSFDTGGRERNEYGLTAAATVNLASVDKTGLFIEARYNRGLSNSSKNSAYEEKIDDLLLMAGLRFDAGNDAKATD